MKKALFVSLVASLLTIATAHAGKPVLVSGTWKCVPEKASEYFPKGAYELTLVPPAGNQPESLVLKNQAGNALRGFRNDWAYIIAPKHPKLPYMSLLLDDPTFRTVLLHVAVQIRPGVENGERLACHSESAPVVKDSKVVAFDCATDKAFAREGITRVRFGVRFIDDNKNIEVVPIVKFRNEDEGPIAVLPKKSPLIDLNQNLSVGVGTKGLRISGDADGFYLVELFLYANTAFQRGYVKFKDLEGGGKGDDYSTVTCRVK